MVVGGCFIQKKDLPSSYQKTHLIYCCFLQHHQRKNNMLAEDDKEQQQFNALLMDDGPLIP